MLFFFHNILPCQYKVLYGSEMFTIRYGLFLCVLHYPCFGHYYVDASMELIRNITSTHVWEVVDPLILER